MQITLGAEGEWVGGGKVDRGKESFQGSQYQDIPQVSDLCSWMIVYITRKTLEGAEIWWGTRGVKMMSVLWGMQNVKCL